MSAHQDQRASAGETRNRDRAFSVASGTRVKLGIGDRACRVCAGTRGGVLPPDPRQPADEEE